MTASAAISQRTVAVHLILPAKARNLSDEAEGVTRDNKKLS
jgi:hypothetical protein